MWQEAEAKSDPVFDWHSVTHSTNIDIFSMLTAAFNVNIFDNCCLLVNNKDKSWLLSLRII